MALLGCPFCRELFSDDEAESCSVCGVPLLPIDRLPPSYDARARREAERRAVPPEDRRLPWTYLGRGRGALILSSLCGLGLFFAPWIDMTRPDDIVLSGFLLARLRAGWFWGGAVGWFTLLALVVTRRTVYQMRGVRIIAATFASLTAIEAVLLFSSPPQGGRYLPVEFRWGWGLYASLIVSLIAVAFAARLGGRLEDAHEIFDDADPPQVDASAPQTLDAAERPHRTTHGETLH